MTTTKPAPMPCIDLGARFQVIDESSGIRRWKTIATGYATVATAKRIAARHGLPGVWMNDGFDRKYITKDR